MQNDTELYRTIHDYTGLYRAIQDYTGLYRTNVTKETTFKVSSKSGQ